jgi:hypothetical protein
LKGAFREMAGVGTTTAGNVRPGAFVEKEGLVANIREDIASVHDEHMRGERFGIHLRTRVVTDISKIGSHAGASDILANCMITVGREGRGMATGVSRVPLSVEEFCECS